DRVDQDPRLRVHRQGEVAAVPGTTMLASVTIEAPRTSPRPSLPASAMFILIGAAPNTGWLRPTVMLDQDGFVVTGSSLAIEAHDDEPWHTLGRGPLPLETSVPGVFAAGDIRADSIKPVGPAGGDGSPPPPLRPPR